MQSPKGIPQPKKEQKVPENQPIKGQIIQVFNQLHDEIEQMNDRVQFIMSKHQAQFILAYQNHMNKIKGDLQILRARTNQQQKELKNNDRAILMSKQATVFREQSLKLYEKLEEKTQQCQAYKFKAKDLQKTSQIVMKQIRQVMKTKKVLQSKLSSAEQQIAELEGKLSEKQTTIRQLNEIRSQNSKISRTKSFDINNSPKMLFNYLDRNETFVNSKLKQSTKVTLSKKSHAEFKKKTISLAYGRDNQLKDWFLDCVKSIKRQIATRKNMGNQLNLENIQSIEDFKIIDKLRLLQKFLENEKLLVWMYQKIFPSRINQIREYISQRNGSPLDHQKFETVEDFNMNSSNYLQTDKQRNNGTNIDQRLQVTLPKMQIPKVKHIYARNRVSITGGQLNLTNPLFTPQRK